MLNLLIKIQENKEIIRKAKEIAKNDSTIYSMKKIKKEFEEEKLKYKSIDSSIKEVQDKIQHIEKKLNDLKEERKLEEDKLYRNLKYDLKLINSLEKSIQLKEYKIKELEEENLNFLYKEEELSQQKECSRKKLIDFRNNFYDYKKNSNKKIIEVKESIKKAEEDIVKCQKHVSKELLNEFNKLSSIKGTGAARLSDGVCLGCKMKVSAITIDDVRKNKNIVYCDNCGRIIHYNHVAKLK